MSKSKVRGSQNPGGSNDLDESSDSLQSANELQNQKVLIKQRQYMRQRVTMIHKKVVVDNIEMTTIAARYEVDKLRTLWPQLTSLNEQIILSAPDQEIANRAEEDDIYDFKITEALSRLEAMMPELGPILTRVDQDSTSRNNSSALKLPKIKLPIFSNAKDQDFCRFLKEFEDIIERHQLSSFEKFVHLKDCLTGSPKVLIDGLDRTQQTYEEARSLLKKAFGSTLDAQYNVIERLVNLKMHNSSDPYNFIGEASGIVNAFRSLKITTEVVLQCILWNNMSPRFQNHITQITNNNQPSLDEIMNVIFKAAERFQKQNKQIQQFKGSKSPNNEKQANDKPGQTTSYAANVKGRFNPCCLCQHDKVENVDHSLRRCTKYDTPSGKVNKLKLLKGCLKCGNLRHKEQDCKFVFSSKCRQCDGMHMSFLCVSKNKKKEEHEASTSISTCTVTYCFNAARYSYDINNSTILPTATCKVMDDHARILKDSGSEENYITHELAKDHALPTIMDNVVVIINGVNSKRKIRTSVVEVPLKFKDFETTVPAIVIPSIDICLKIDKLQHIVDGFTSKGLTLADEFLDSSDMIGDISLILGADTEHLFDVHCVSFGDETNQSCYLRTSMGIMITGKAEKLRNILHLIPEQNDQNEFLLNSVIEENNAVDATSQDVRHSELVSNTSVEYSVLNEEGNVDHEELERAVEDIEKQFSKVTQIDNDVETLNDTRTNLDIIDSILENTDRSHDGRLIMPLPWHHEGKNNLSRNYKLAVKVLESTYRKLSQNPEKLSMYDEVFREQVKDGIIKPISDVNSYLKQGDISFLAHMGVFRMNRETSRIRVVFLSNLTDGTNGKLSHNKALLPGPSLNRDITFTLMSLRFDKYMFIFDLKKAFLQIELKEEDKKRLNFLWYENISDNNYKLLIYQPQRLVFGLRPSPCILMLGLYKILVIDRENDDDETKEICKLAFELIYVDNAAYTCNQIPKLFYAYEVLKRILNEYRFDLQQIHSNRMDFQQEVNCEQMKDKNKDVKLLGMNWDKENDKINPIEMKLDAAANTRRKIVSSLNSLYDTLNIYAPLLNRAKLFTQKLQSDTDLQWDSIINENYIREWKNICSQFNVVPKLSIDRFIGSREDNYYLVAYSDASKQLYGCVIYILNRNNGKINFLCSKNRVIGKALSKKSIPSLELHSLKYTVENLMKLYNEFTGSKNITPIAINRLMIFSDSMVALHWVRNYSITLSKMSKDIFTMNRLESIEEMCHKKEILFRHVAGGSNPADHISRPTSYNQLLKSNYLEGPTIDCNENALELSFVVPDTRRNMNEDCESGGIVNEIRTVHTSVATMQVTEDLAKSKLLIPLEKFSSFRMIVNVHMHVIKFIHLLKVKAGFAGSEPRNYSEDALKYILRCVQQEHYEDVLTYFRNKTNKSSMPDIIGRCNLYIGSDALIHCKNKLPTGYQHPVLLPNKSLLTELIIKETHDKLSHSGLFVVLRELRAHYWIPHVFTLVRSVLHKCIICRRYNARTVKLNQNDYRDFRLETNNVPFDSVFLDYMGPFTTKVGTIHQKVYILVIVCTWSRCVNLKLCMSLDVTDFLRAVQTHIFEYGLFRRCISDLGTQILSGCKIITNYLKDDAVKKFLNEHAIENISFQNYPKGKSSLGGLVENLVKQSKLLIRKSIRNTVIKIADFDYLIVKTRSLINKRPIATKEALRDGSGGLNVEEIITPELLLYGRELISMNVIPQLLPTPDNDEDYRPSGTSDLIRSRFKKLAKIRERLINQYNQEFRITLINQATDKKQRYSPVKHVKLSVGDIVLLRDDFCKQSQYPMAIVESVVTNSLGEVTAAYLFKGVTREKVFRHASSLILLLPASDEIRDDQRESASNPIPNDVLEDIAVNENQIRSKRRAAQQAEQRIIDMIALGLI